MVNVFSKNLKDALHRYPFILDFFESYGIPLERDLTVEDAINSIPDERLEEIGVTRDALKEQLLSFIGDMESLLEEERVESITIKCKQFVQQCTSGKSVRKIIISSFSSDAL